MFVDCVISAFALDFYLTRVSVENNLEVQDKEKLIEKYDYIYKENKKLSNFINKYWGNNVMVKTYPNVAITLTNQEKVLAKNYFPDIAPYYYKFARGD